MKIINLVEDTKGCECCNQHGLSFYIETQNHKILVDSGATGMFIRNAEMLGVDLTQIDTAILSHGHYDHSGGLLEFAKINPNAKIYVTNSVGEDYYRVSPGVEKYIGIDKNILNLPQIIKVSEDTQLDDELFLFMGFDEKRYPTWSNQALKQKVGNSFVQDSFDHEQCLVIKQNESRILLSGCAHNGILSILDRYYKLLGSYPNIVVSGFHMMKNSDYTNAEIEYIKQTAYELSQTKALFYTGHCTGDKAFDIMKEIMGEKLHKLYSGFQFEF